MIARRLKQLLNKEKVSYQVIEAPGNFPIGASKKDCAKTVIVRAGAKEVMVVTPSFCELDLEKLRVLLDEPNATVESDSESAHLFPDCEQGAEPAIGRLYGIPCFVDETVLDGSCVCFKGGHHHEWVRISSDEYWRIAQAEIGDFRLRRVPV